MPPHHCVTMLVSHLPCPLPPNQSVICLAPCHQTSQSFYLPSTTVSLRHRITMLVSHLPCPLPPNKSVICLAPATEPVSHLPCPLPPNQLVIWLALYYRVTVPPHHCIRFSPPHGYESDWLMLTSTVLIFFPTTSLKWSHEARIDELADSNEPAKIRIDAFQVKVQCNP